MELKLTTGEQLRLTKTEINNVATDMIERVKDGEIKALEALAKLSFMQAILEQAIKEIRPIATNEAETYGKKTFGDYGVEFTIKETGVKYDYSADKEWSEYQENINAIKLMQKGRETVLKGSGQYAKTSTTSLSVQFPK